MADPTSILCIEDEPMLLEDIADELRDAGYKVLEARNGRIGVEAATRHDPDLILCDVMMPEMDGAEVLAAVRRLPGPVADTPFIFLTAKATRDDVVAGKRLGADDYLTKPVDFDLLLATVETRLAHVGRIRKRSEKEMIRIYRAMAPRSRRQNDKVRIGLLSRDLPAVKIIRNGLGAMGCSVQCFANEADFVTQAARVEIDLLFVHEDAAFDFMSAEDLRKIVGKRSLPVFRLASQRDRNFPADSRPGNGFDATIAYPYRPAEIFQSIMSSFEGVRRPSDPATV